MLRKIRRTLAVLFFACITLLFLDFTGTLHAWLGWMARVQFLPAVLALNVGVVAALAVLTLLFGRVYCSVVCPLGVFQDLVAWLGGRGKRRKYRFSYSPARRWLRCGTLALFVAALVAGVGSLVALLAPYSAYGRIASNFFRPVYLWGNNALAAVAERVGSYAFYETEVRVAGLPTLLIAAATCAVLVVLAWRNGRTYCNTVCPVGTVLGFLSKYALFRPVIDPEKCRLRLVRPGVQGRLYRLPEPPDRLFALRGLHGLPRRLQARGGRLPVSHEDRRIRSGSGGRKTDGIGGSCRYGPPEFPDRNGAVARCGGRPGAGKESGRRSGRHSGQAGAAPHHAPRAAGRPVPAPSGDALHGLPALRLGLS